MVLSAVLAAARLADTTQCSLCVPQAGGTECRAGRRPPRRLHPVPLRVPQAGGTECRAGRRPPRRPPSAPSVSLRLVVLSAVLAAVRLDDSTQCSLDLRKHAVGYVVILSGCVVIEASIGWLSMRGSILNTRPRDSIQYLLYIRLGGCSPLTLTTDLTLTGDTLHQARWVLTAHTHHWSHTHWRHSTSGSVGAHRSHSPLISHSLETLYIRLGGCSPLTLTTDLTLTGDTLHQARWVLTAHTHHWSLTHWRHTLHQARWVLTAHTHHWSHTHWRHSTSGSVGARRSHSPLISHSLETHYIRLGGCSPLTLTTDLTLTGDTLHQARWVLTAHTHHWSHTHWRHTLHQARWVLTAHTHHWSHTLHQALWVHTALTFIGDIG